MLVLALVFHICWTQCLGLLIMDFCILISGMIVYSSICALADLFQISQTPTILEKTNMKEQRWPKILEWLLGLYFNLYYIVVLFFFPLFKTCSTCQKKKSRKERKMVVHQAGSLIKLFMYMIYGYLFSVCNYSKNDILGMISAYMCSRVRFLCCI